VFDRLRYRRDDRRVFLYAFDLIELDGNDLRREPIERRKMLLIRLLAKARVGLQVNDRVVEPRDVVFRHDVRRALDPHDREAATRGDEILVLHKAILVASAAFVLWIVLFKAMPMS
jgi:hypothetical protein